MSASSNAVAKKPEQEGQHFVAAVKAAMRRAARKVALENKRLGLPLIAEKPQRASRSRQ